MSQARGSALGVKVVNSAVTTFLVFVVVVIAMLPAFQLLSLWRERTRNIRQHRDSLGGGHPRPSRWWHQGGQCAETSVDSWGCEVCVRTQRVWREVLFPRWVNDTCSNSGFMSVSLLYSPGRSFSLCDRVCLHTCSPRLRPTGHAHESYHGRCALTAYLLFNCPSESRFHLLALKPVTKPANGKH